MGVDGSYLRRTLFIFVFILCFIVFPSVLTTGYYADIHISIDASGFVDIKGDTNHPDLLVTGSEQYTLKKESIWLFNMTKNDSFSGLVFTLYLPKGSSISHIQSSAAIRIKEEAGRLVVTGFAENTNFILLVQYEVKRLSSFPGGLLSLSLLIVTLCLVAIFIYMYRRKNNVSTDKKEAADKSSYKGLNNRQKEIMHLLLTDDSGLTQTDIQRLLNIPKASVSRNIRRLELKGLIEKEQIGISNIIRLKKH